MDQTADEIRSASRMGTVMGVILLILGMLALAAPMVSGLAVAISVGIILLLGGIIEIAFAFQARSWGKGLMSVLLGGFSLVGGLVMLARPVLGLASLTLVLAIYFVVDGLTHIVGSFQVKPAPGWGWVLFGGIVSLLLGLLIWNQWPLSGAWAIGVLIGLRLILVGWSMIALGGMGRAAAAEMEA